MCGRTNPTNPMAPDVLTIAAVIRAVRMSREARIAVTFTPSEAAEVSPKAKASNDAAEAMQAIKPSRANPLTIHTSVQEALASEPNSQNRTPRVCSASAEVNTMNDVNAENS